jgi:NADH:ubiquinone oxidoreductase subunit D
VQLQVQLVKKLPFNTLQAQIDSVKGEEITYVLVDGNEMYYTLHLKYPSPASYTAFMERLHKLWRRKYD